MSLTLSVLDQSPVRSGGTPADAVRETLELARAADRLGYHRYWVAEHHGTHGLAGCAPEILIPRIAEVTRRMRVGSGGVMLSHYSPYKVAEMFRLLEVMYPGRIDLGVGRAPGSDYVTARALAWGAEGGLEYFPAKVLDLRAFLTGERPVTEGLDRVLVTPVAEGVPELWLLGSSDASASLAARFGLPLSYAHFISPHGGAGIVEAYRRGYVPGPGRPEPVANVGVFVVCAETDEEAERLARSRDLWRVRLARGELGPYPSPEEAQAHRWTPAERAFVEANRARSVVGSPERVRRELDGLAAAYGVTELVVVTITWDFRARLRSYELLAEAFGLEGD